jgi:hypothetical protein
MYEPTAMQKLSDTQDTPDSELSPDVDGTGTGIEDQALPFHDWAIAAGRPVPEACCPTATHQLGEVQETPPSELSTAAFGLGVGTTVHVDASRTSASAATPPRLLPRLPTAAQKSEPVQDTASSIPSGAFGGGTGWRDQPPWPTVRTGVDPAAATAPGTSAKTAVTVKPARSLRRCLAMARIKGHLLRSGLEAMTSPTAQAATASRRTQTLTTSGPLGGASCLSGGVCAMLQGVKEFTGGRGWLTM